MRGKPTEKTKPGTAQSVAEILRDHVTLELEGIDRMYLNVYIPRLQTVEGVLGFIRRHRGHKVASTAMVEPITRAFVGAIERFAAENGITVVNFEKGQRKDDVAARFLAGFKEQEGVLFIGKAQEKCRVYRTEKRRNPHTGVSYAWIVKSTALVNHYYFYCVDRNFGPFFLKFCSYFPYGGKLCLNGHEYAKRQLERSGIAYEALDNGVLSCTASASHLQRAFSGQNRRASAQVAGKIAPSVYGSGPQGRLSLRSFDSADRVVADAGAGPACQRPHLLRAGNSGKSGYRKAEAGTVDF